MNTTMKSSSLLFIKGGVHASALRQGGMNETMEKYFELFPLNEKTASLAVDFANFIGLKEWEQYGPLYR